MAPSSFQTLTIEYRVHDRCDGTTEAPPFSEGVLDERQIYVFEVARLGVIPLRFDDAPVNPPLPAAPATRIITWAVLTGIQTSTDFGSGLTLGLVERVAGLGTVPVEPVAQITAGSEGVYLRRCVNVPQGCVLLVNQIQAPPGYMAIIRLRVQQLQNGEQQQQLSLACCCKRDLVDINVPDGVNEPCPPGLTLNQVSPFQASLSNTLLTNVTITGSGFSSLAEVRVAFANESNQLPVSNVILVDDNTITADVLPNAIGNYDAFVGQSETCFVMAPRAFGVIGS
jgi:hypothetical protein